MLDEHRTLDADLDLVDEAERAVVAGELVEAARCADAVLAEPDAEPCRLARAAHVLAAVHAHRGLLADAADLHAWVAAAVPGSASPAAAVALVGTGRAPVEPASAAGRPAPPTLRAGAEGLVGRAVTASVRPGGSAAALSELTRAAAVLECRGGAVLLDDSPAALGALVALHRGEPDLARSLTDRAVAADLGGAPHRRRHLLLRAWADMAGGDLGAAHAGLETAAARPEPVHARDELVAVALEAGLVRRAGDTRGLLALWTRAREAVLHHAVDLWSLLAIGELVVVAGRLGQQTWLAPHAESVDELLAALDRPVLWAAPWDWCAFLAAVAADDPPAAQRHAAHLADAASDPAAQAGSLATVLARAARVWLHVLAGEVDLDEVTAATTALAGAGMAYDGARLAKEAAVRTTDKRVLSAMLGLARGLLAGPSSAEDPTPAATPTVPEPAAPETGPRPPSRPAVLSEREREVAELLLDGMTYREIGDRLFISAKTVEHHVGRMRQRLGSESRTGLFADLRDALAS
ncbi:helix-turn-helix transcriptional regulator [Actinomycetospora sp. TBRC 11914]|uniref:helix-turn-helix domain-containing protein n=1 Tax=Actinomycetospora sp. TBRC 11914 TaxID=2729387 RepID=UPI00145CDD0F|nr:helix-turn-helix transcriptional regulator [Actinomycetospora sp. TBRC 11914]NMO93251.1 helix-turn-helix transcriptional regulator [Actinomycetospora sp. TBRC 11914]